MVHVEEIPKMSDQPPLALRVLETAQLPSNARVRAADVLRSERRNELNLSGSQLLLRFTSAFSAVSLLLWAILKLWLFE